MRPTGPTTAHPSPFQGKTAFYFGSFNPIHLGHAWIARTAMVQFALDRVLFVPAAQPPNRAESADLLPGSLRYACVEVAIRPYAGLAVTDLELQRPGPSYTADSLESLLGVPLASLPEGSVPFIAGADTLYTLPSWKRAAELVRVCHFLQAPRPTHRPTAIGSVALASGETPLATTLLEMPPQGVSSTWIRRQIGVRPELAKLWLPEGVFEQVAPTLAPSYS